MQYSQENIYAGVFFTCRLLAGVLNVKLNLKINFDPATVTVPGVNLTFYVKWIKEGDFPGNL